MCVTLTKVLLFLREWLTSKFGAKLFIVMDKYADLNWSFSELLAAGEGDAKIARYISWIVGTYATPAVKDPQKPGGRFWLVCQSLRLEAQAEGISTKRPSESLRDVCGDLHD